MIIDRLWASQPGKFFCISTKNLRGKWKDHFFRRTDIKNITTFFIEHADKDTYFCPHGFSQARRIRPYAVLPNMLWADLDEADPRKMKLKPSIAIESSPGRYVGLWLLDKEMTEGLNRRLTYFLGADKGGWDLTQVLRVPGTINYKYQNLPRVKILWSDGPEYTTKEIEALLPEEEVEEEGTGVAAIFKKYEKEIPRWARRELVNGQPKIGQRSDMIWKLEHTLIECGVSTDEAFELIKASAWNKFKGRDEQLRRELEKALDSKFTAKRPVVGESEGDDYKWLSTTLEDVQEEQIDWIWYPYLARGELTILEGDPGLGKSYIAEMVSGAICDGERLPTIKRFGKVQGKVVYFDIENSAASITKKRIRENGFKNMKNFVQEERPFSIDDDETLDKIYDALERVRPILVVFDTINTYLGKADAFKGHEAQQAFVRFREIAKRFNCAVLVLRHLTKSSKDNVRALYRGQGSIAFAGLARVVLSVGSMPDDEDTKVMAVTKLNITRKPKALTFQVIGLPDTLKDQDRSRFEWGSFVEVSSDDILHNNGNGKDGTEHAQKFLKAILEEGPVDLKRIERMAEARGVSRRKMYQAAEELGVKRQIIGKGSERRGTWSLSPDEGSEKVVSSHRLDELRRARSKKDRPDSHED